MRVPLSWLKEFTPLEADARHAESIEGLRRILDSLGLVVEEMEQIGAGLQDVVVAHVVAINSIEKADRIRQIFVDAGGNEDLEIVCGAWNFEVGDAVPLAPVGTTLPNGMAIAQRKMRGVTSNGMLCSGVELGLSKDSDGLMILAHAGEKATPGMALVEHLHLVPDIVFDLAVEPNRPDCLSITGVARDLAARLGLPFSLPVPKVHESGPAIEELATLSVEEPTLCPRFVVHAITDVEVIASSPLVAHRLMLCGMRPINAIVDVSNYVMLELGQPSHPYDLDRLGGGGLRVRLAQPGERLQTLDGQERVLGTGQDAFGKAVGTDDLLICDAADRPVGLAGIMGGQDSEIQPATTRIALEVAQFDPLTIGRSAARLNLRSDASQRFWRGIDSAGQRRAADRFCELLCTIYQEAGHKAPHVASGVLHFDPTPWQATRLQVRPSRVNGLLGTTLSPKEIAKRLKPIGFVTKKHGSDLDVDVPSYRPDVTREVDVIEEIARQGDYASIARTQRRSPYVGRLSPEQHMRRVARRVCVASGAHEAWTSSLIEPDLGGVAGTVTAITLTNPIVPAEHALRTNLLSGLLGALSYNASHRNASLRLFEIGHVFSQRDGEVIEKEQLAMVLAQDGDDAQSAVAALRDLLRGLSIDADSLHWRQPAIDGAGRDDEEISVGCHPSRMALLYATGDEQAQPLGVVGEVDPEVAGTFGLRDRRIGWFVFDTAALFDLPPKIAKATVVSHFPSSDIDLAFVLGEHLPAVCLETALRGAAGESCEFVRLVDVYRDASLPPRTRSLAYRLRFCASDHTLEESELAALRSACIQAAGAIGARLRD